MQRARYSRRTLRIKQCCNDLMWSPSIASPSERILLSDSQLNHMLRWHHALRDKYIKWAIRIWESRQGNDQTPESL